MEKLKEVGDRYNVVLKPRGERRVATVLEVDRSEFGAQTPYFVSVGNTGIRHWCYANGDSNIGTFSAVVEDDFDDEAELTPCEEAGYAEGDKFTYLGGAWFENGAIITLVEDDDTDTPRFIGADGQRFYVHLSHVEPFPSGGVGRKPVGFQYHIVYMGAVAIATIIRQRSDGGYDIGYKDVFTGWRGTHSVLSNGDSNIGAFKALDFNR